MRWASCPHDMKFNFNIKEKIKNFIVKYNQIIDYKNFFLGILGYGLLINYGLWAIFGITFNWYTFPAYGLAYYFIMEEFVLWIRRITARR